MVRKWGKDNASEYVREGEGGSVCVGEKWERGEKCVRER